MDSLCVETEGSSKDVVSFLVESLLTWKNIFNDTMTIDSSSDSHEVNSKMPIHTDQLMNNKYSGEKTLCINDLDFKATDIEFSAGQVKIRNGKIGPFRTQLFKKVSGDSVKIFFQKVGNDVMLESSDLEMIYPFSSVKLNRVSKINK